MYRKTVVGARELNTPPVLYYIGRVQCCATLLYLDIRGLDCIVPRLISSK